MRTFKWVGLFLLIVSGLIVLSGCDSYRAYYAGSGGLDISIQGGNVNITNVIVKTADRSFTVQITEGSLPLWWYYDVPAGDPEYVIVDYHGEGQANSDISYLFYKLRFIKALI
jgi:hypothetical protein